MQTRHFLLIYSLADDYLERRGAFRSGHLGLAQQFAEDGQLLLGGAMADPPDQAVFIFKGADDAGARAFVEADPYVANGLVRDWAIREWTTVIGKDAAAPVIV